MNKRYVFNPDTNRLVTADGYTGLKIINKLLTKGMQIKYHSSKKEQSLKKKETPTKKQAEQKKKKKNDTFVIDLTNQQEQTSKKIQQPKQNPKKTKKTQSETKQQGRQLIVKKDLIKIKQEIKDFYDAIAERYILASETEVLYEGIFSYVREIYIDENNLEKMKTFMKISGLSLEKLKQICDNVYAKHIFDAEDEDAYDARYDYDPLDYSLEVLYKIINTGSFANDPTVKNELKNYLREVTNNIKGKVHG